MVVVTIGSGHSSLQYRGILFPSETERRRKVINFSSAAEPLGVASPLEPNLPHEHSTFLSWLFRQSGLDVRIYRSESLLRRLPACLRHLRVRSIGEARRLLEAHPSMIADAMSAMLVGVTSFFRDPAVFQALGRDLLPSMARGRSSLYVWSAGCSDGSELYSVAMLLEALGILQGSYLLGTDCRSDAIQRARAASYDPIACKNVPPEFMARYMEPSQGQLKVVSTIRSAARWRTADVSQVQEPGIWDLILCRNTTMYMRTDATAALWSCFESLLRPGGILVVGKAERPIGAKRLMPLGSCLYRRARG